MKVKVLSRVGGSPFDFDIEECLENYKRLSQDLRYYNKQKRKYLDKDHREMDHKLADGTVVTKAAGKTGIGFFKAPEQIQQEMVMAKTLYRKGGTNDALAQTQYTDRDEHLDGAEFDPEKHQLIDLDKVHSDYRRFNSRYFDDDLEIEDMVNVLIPAVPESSNVLLFELVLLQSADIEKDYVVGWGVFPIVNSEFQVNEGKFKCPLLFGNVNRKFDKFSRLEELMVKDLDNWLGNLYFEIEKVNLMDLLVDKNTGQLFFAPLRLLKTRDQEI